MVTKKGLVITVESSKTEKRGNAHRVIIIPRLKNKVYCPVETWVAYKLQAQGGTPSDPAFMLSPGVPLTIRTATNILRLSLQTLKVPDVSKFTFHSFRRGSAQACESAGLSLETIKQLGHWSSDAVMSYLQRKAINPPQALFSLFG